MTDAPPSPSPEQGRALHARLLAGDPVAPADLAEAYLESLAAWLERQNPRVTDPHLCTVAAGEAIIALIKAPRSYDPARRSLEGYLRMSAQGDLRNLLRTERRHSLRRASLDAVELSPVAGKDLWDVEGDPARIVDQEAELTAIPPPKLPGLTPQEERVLALLRQGERRTIAYARVLDIEYLPVPEQRQEVKRVKDRLQKRLTRAGGRDG
jgi:plasmid stabilization system protein ParE